MPVTTEIVISPPPGPSHAENVFGTITTGLDPDNLFDPAHPESTDTHAIAARDTDGKTIRNFRKARQGLNWFDDDSAIEQRVLFCVMESIRNCKQSMTTLMVP